VLGPTGKWITNTVVQYTDRLQEIVDNACHEANTSAGLCWALQGMVSFLPTVCRCCPAVPQLSPVQHSTAELQQGNNESARRPHTICLGSYPSLHVAHATHRGATPHQPCRLQHWSLGQQTRPEAVLPQALPTSSSP